MEDTKEQATTEQESHVRLIQIWGVGNKLRVGKKQLPALATTTEDDFFHPIFTSKAKCEEYITLLDDLMLYPLELVLVGEM